MALKQATRGAGTASPGRGGWCPEGTSHCEGHQNGWEGELPGMSWEVMAEQGWTGGWALERPWVQSPMPTRAELP